MNLTITAPDGSTYQISEDDLFDIAWDAQEVRYTDDRPDYEKSIVHALLGWIADLDLSSLIKEVEDW